MFPVVYEGYPAEADNLYDLEVVDAFQEPGEEGEGVRMADLESMREMYQNILFSNARVCVRTCCRKVSRKW